MKSESKSLVFTRYYADVPHCTRCVFCGTLKIFEFVGADIIRPPTLQISGQNRYTPTGAPILQMYHVTT